MDSHSDAGSDPFDDGSTHTQNSTGSEISMSTSSFNGYLQHSFDTDTTVLLRSGSDEWLQNLNDEGWEKLGRNIANQSRVEIRLYDGAINDHVEDMNPDDGSLDADDEIQLQINEATEINSMYEGVSNPEAAGREKLIQTLLRSDKRAALCRLQGVDRSVYSEIDPLHLPEILSLIGRHHGQGGLHLALKSFIMTLFSTINVRKCIQQQRAYHAAKVAKHAAIVAEHAAVVAEHRMKMEKLDAKLASMDEAVEVNEGSNELEHRSNKRRRKWWWGLWGGA
eukprot:scaffold1188_cov78-Skeletonema_dohrnii-CCMP3373.AAC.3